MDNERTESLDVEKYPSEDFSCLIEEKNGKTKDRRSYSIFLAPICHNVTWDNLGGITKTSKRKMLCDDMKGAGWDIHPYLRPTKEDPCYRFSPAPHTITREVAAIHFGRKYEQPSKESAKKKPATSCLCVDEIIKRLSPEQGDHAEPLFLSLDKGRLRGKWCVNVGSSDEPHDVSFAVPWVDLLLYKDNIGLLSFKTIIQDEQAALTNMSSLHRALRDFNACTEVDFENSQKEKADFWQDIVIDQWFGRGKVLMLPVDKGDETVSGKSVFITSQRYVKVLSFAETAISEQNSDLWNRPIADPAVKYTPQDREMIKNSEWSLKSLGAQNAVIAGYPTVRDLLLFELATVSDMYASVAWQGQGRGYQYSVEYIRKILENNLIEVWEYWSGLALRDTCTFISYDKSMPIKWQAESRYYPLYMMTYHLRLRLEQLSTDIIEHDLADVYRGRAIKRDLIEFRNHYWFKEVTKDFVGVEVFAAMKQGMEVEELFEQVNSEIIDVTDYLKQRWERGNRILLVFLLVFFAPIKGLWDKSLEHLDHPWPEIPLYMVTVLAGAVGALLLWLMTSRLLNAFSWWKRLRRRTVRFISNLSRLDLS